MVKADYHVHTGYCPHASGSVKEYIESAIRRGIKELGFCDHLPFLNDFTDDYTMAYEELSEYVQEIFDLRNAYKDDIIIKLGIEADFIPDMQEKVAELLSQHPFDFVCGSVHFIDKWAFDVNDAKSRWASADVDKIYSEYINILKKASQSGLFSFLGHIDLVKKFGYRPSRFNSDEWEDLACSVKENDMAIEINSSGLRKEVFEIYPSLEILKIFKKKEVPIVFGSDAHNPDEVASDFDKACRLALEAGYTQAVTFTDKKKSQIYDLQE